MTNQDISMWSDSSTSFTQIRSGGLPLEEMTTSTMPCVHSLATEHSQSKNIDELIDLLCISIILILKNIR